MAPLAGGPGPAPDRGQLGAILDGRRVATWEARNDPATERYRYLYDEEELAEHLRRIVKLSEQKSEALHVIFNNCHGNYAVTNAAKLSILM